MQYLSVVIPTYNRKSSLLRTLDALARQAYPSSDFEVLVVSDGATDGTCESVRARQFAFRLRVLEQLNAGPSVARNLGARTACGEIIVFVDDDVEPAPGFLEAHAAAHSADDSLVLIGPQSMPRGERFPVWIAWEHRMLERQYARFRSGAWQTGPNNLYSGNFSVRRDHLLRCGGFDEAFKRQEDVELGYRLAAQGLHFRFAPDAEAWHRPERTFSSWYDTPHTYGVRDVQMARDKGNDAAMKLARKHYGERSLPTRILARLVIGRRIEKPAFSFLRRSIHAFDRNGLRHVALPVCSITFNLRYLQGMAAELGGAAPMWRAMQGPAEPAREGA